MRRSTWAARPQSWCRWPTSCACAPWSGPPPPRSSRTPRIPRRYLNGRRGTLPARRRSCPLTRHAVGWACGSNTTSGRSARRPRSWVTPAGTICGMARFSTYAEVLTPDHIQWEVHARGLGCPDGPGLVLQEVLDRNGGRYQNTMSLSDRFREQARICAEVSGDQEMARIAGLPEGTISLEHLRGLDQATRIVCGCELSDFTDPERARLPRDEGPADPARIIEGLFDPANPRRILRA